VGATLAGEEAPSQGAPAMEDPPSGAQEPLSPP